MNDPFVLKIIDDIWQAADLLELLFWDEFLNSHFPIPVKTPAVVTWVICSSKVAVTIFVPSMVISIWFVVSVEDPDQLLNIHPVCGAAFKRTTVPELYSSEFLSELIIVSVMVPSPNWPIIRVYFDLIKLAVILLSLVILTVNGLVVPSALPDQPLKVNPAAGVAVIITSIFSLWMPPVLSTDPPSEAETVNA